MLSTTDTKTYKSTPSTSTMPPRGASFSSGLVAQRGLQAKQCKLLRASTERHARLNLRMRSEDVAHEISNAVDGERNASRVYEVLVSTGKHNVRLDVRRHDEVRVELPMLTAENKAVSATFEVRRVRSLVAGLRSSEFVHRALLEIAAITD